MLHQGYRKEPVPYKGTKLYIKGDRITKSGFEWLNRQFGLYNCTEVVITGGSAGGMATFLWSNYLNKLVKGEVYSIIDSGVFLNFPNFQTGYLFYEELCKSVMKFANT